ncbi:hypothetical protein ACWGKQ_34510 [Streptomyces sp. NPDC054770]
MVTHDLRRFFAPALIVGGASIQQARLVLDLRPGEEDRTRTVMAAVFGGLRSGCGRRDTAT